MESQPQNPEIGPEFRINPENFHWSTGLQFKFMNEDKKLAVCKFSRSQTCLH